MTKLSILIQILSLEVRYLYKWLGQLRIGSKMKHHYTFKYFTYPLEEEKKSRIAKLGKAHNNLNISFLGISCSPKKLAIAS